MNSSPHHHHHENGATVDYYLWSTGVSSEQRRQQNMPRPNRQPDTPAVWEPLPQSWFDKYQIAGDTIDASMRSQDNWHFNDVGQGAFTFEARNAGGNLVIALSGWKHSDLNGYYIVLDDDNHESYVLKVARLGNNGLARGRVDGPDVSRRREYAKVSGGNVFVDGNFRLNFDSPQYLWVMYQFGTIVVGEGTVPGRGRIILYMLAEPQATATQEGQRRTMGSDLYHYGFARHGSRWKTPITISNTRSYRYRPNSNITLGPSGGGQTDVFPLPQNPLAQTQPAPPAPLLEGILYRRRQPRLFI